MMRPSVFDPTFDDCEWTDAWTRVPVILAVREITLSASPASTMVTDSTALCSGSTLRDTIDFRPTIMLAATTIGSIVVCGRAAWPPWPVMSI